MNKLKPLQRYRAGSMVSVDSFGDLVAYSDAQDHIARLEAENAALKAQLLEPAEQCENCDDYYAASVMQTTEDDVRLCPGCWEACCEETEG